MSRKGAFLCLEAFSFGGFVNGQLYIFWGQFIDIRGNQSKIVGKLKILGTILKLLGQMC